MLGVEVSEEVARERFGMRIRAASTGPHGLRSIVTVEPSESPQMTGPKGELSRQGREVSAATTKGIVRRHLLGIDLRDRKRINPRSAYLGGNRTSPVAIQRDRVDRSSDR
jgi:hypothetical protein